MFTKTFVPITICYFLENRPAPILGKISRRGEKPAKERTWLALSLVLCAHLGVFAALRPEPQPLSTAPVPEPIMISLLSAPQTVPQKPAPPIPVQQQQKPVKKPVSKPVVPVIKKAGQPMDPPVEQASVSPPQASAPAAEATPKPTQNKTADAQTYQSPNFEAAYLNNPAPDYPSVSRRLGEQGLVLLQVQVTEDGAADSVELQTGSGSSRLDQAALEAVKQWRFVPAKRGDQPVSASVVVPVRFSLEG
ncbi:MAG: TonB family protein [Methylobacter sp.]